VYQQLIDRLVVDIVVSDVVDFLVVVLICLTYLHLIEVVLLGRIFGKKFIY
jgi:hypothetical protein